MMQRILSGAVCSAAVLALMLAGSGCKSNEPLPAAPAGGSTEGMPASAKQGKTPDGTPAPAYADPSKVPTSKGPGHNPYGP